MNANGTNQTRLTFSGSGLRDEQPAWSPNGMKLAFTSTRDSIVETWQETDDEGAILTRTAVRSNKEIYVMNGDGSAALRLTNTAENDDSPTFTGMHLQDSRLSTLEKGLWTRPPLRFFN